jgi:hypothetical protein
MKKNKQGVRDLNDRRLADRPPDNRIVKKSAAVPAPESTETVTDLIYAFKGEVSEEILRTFPQAVLESDWDYIHEYRTPVSIENCDRSDWLKFLIQSGMASISLNFQLGMHTDFPLIESLMDEVDPGWRTRARERKRTRQGVPSLNR